ncbi:MAG: MscL family protein [Sporichthyaceae bacterium]|nr:MscL family protein [Sporichthyaceae bacterium]
MLAAGVYFLIVVPYQRWKRRRGEGDTEFEDISDETEELREIRDLLAARGGRT